MKKCPNCGNQITCSCQIRVASNGNKVCSNCITQYEVNNKNLSMNKNLSVINSAILPSN